MRWPLLVVLFLSVTVHAEPVEPERALSLLAAIDESLAQKDLACKQISPANPRAAATSAAQIRFQQKYAGSAVEVITDQQSSIVIRPNEETTIVALLSETGDLISKISISSSVKSRVRVNRGTPRKPKWADEEVTTVIQTECL